MGKSLFVQEEKRFEDMDVDEDVDVDVQVEVGVGWYKEGSLML